MKEYPLAKPQWPSFRTESKMIMNELKILDKLYYLPVRVRVCSSVNCLPNKYTHVVMT